MEAALQQLVWALKDLIMPALGVGMVGFLKWMSPRLKEAIPMWMQPLAAIAFNRIGQKMCYAVGVPCEGNFTNWDDQQTYLFAQGCLAWFIQAFAVWVKRITPGVLKWISQRMEGSPPAAAVAGMLVLMVLMPQPAHASWQFRWVDCKSPADYLAHNGRAAAGVLTIAGGLLTSDSAFTDIEAKPQGSIHYVGIGISALKSFVELGGSPLGALNLVLGFVCHELADVPEQASPD